MNVRANGLQQTRSRRMRAIFGACKQRGFDDDMRRAIVFRITGKASLKDCDPGALGAVLEAIAPRKHAASRGNRPRLSPRQRLIWSLWQQLADAGLVRRRTMHALESWLRAQTGVDKIQWLTSAQESTVIEQLKQWLRRV